MHRGDKPAFWPAALCAVQAFSPAAKTLAEGQFTCPEHLQYRRVERPTGAEPKKKDMTYGHVFLFGGDKRDRTADLLNAIYSPDMLVGRFHYRIDTLLPIDFTGKKGH